MKKKVFTSYILVMILTGCHVELFHDLNEKQANEILMVLRKSHIDAKKIRAKEIKNISWVITVPEDAIETALHISIQNDMPRQSPLGFNELYSNSTLVPTNTEEKAKYISALCGELSKTLEAIDGVLAARIHIALPDKDFSLIERSASQASVAALIKINPKVTNIPDDNEIKLLLSKSIDCVSLDHIAIIKTITDTESIKVPEKIALPEENYIKKLKLLSSASLGITSLLAFLLLKISRKLSLENKSISSRKESSLCPP